MVRKFPDPTTHPPGSPVLCGPDKVVKLYNAAGHPGRRERATRVGKKAKQWFIREATSQGWSGVKFAQEYGTTKSAGCVLWVEPPEPQPVSPTQPVSLPSAKQRRSRLVIIADLIEDIDDQDDD